MFHFTGCGALNLDHIYVIDSLQTPEFSKFSLKPGGEVWGTKNDAIKLKEAIKNVKGELKYLSGGGSSANTITILSKLGWNTAFIGVIGDDKEGEIVIQSMQGVNCEAVTVVGNTAMCVIILDNLRDRAIFVSPHSLEQGFVKEKSLSILKDSKCLHLSSLVYERGLNEQLKLVDNLNYNQLLTFDPGEIYCKMGIEKIKPILKRTNILFITEKEIDILINRNLDTKNPLDKIKFLYIYLDNNNFYYFSSEQKIKLNSPIIVCKRGEKGAMLYSSSEGIIEMPAIKAEQIVDNTGAGDAFNAGFLHALFNGEDLKKCLENATKLAFKSLSNYGRNWL